MSYCVIGFSDSKYPMKVWVHYYDNTGVKRRVVRKIYSSDSGSYVKFKGVTYALQ